MMDFFELEDLRRVKAGAERPAAETTESKPPASEPPRSVLFARRQRWAELLKTNALRRADR